MLLRIIAVFACIISFAGSLNAQTEFAFRFSDKESAPVIELQQQRGPGRQTPRTLMQIYSNGRVVCSGVGEGTELQLSEEHFEELTDVILTQNDFLSISKKGILEELATPQQRVRSMETSVRIVCHTRSGEHAVSLRDSLLADRLGAEEKKHESAIQFQRFLNVEQTCRNLMATVLLGGRDGLDSVVEKANECLKTKFTDAPDLTVSNLKKVYAYEHGRLLARFVVRNEEIAPQPVTIMALREDGEGTFEARILRRKPAGGAARGMHRMQKMAFLPNDFVGLSLSDAQDLAKTLGRSYRVNRNGKRSFAGTMDMQPMRLNFQVDDGVVTSCKGG